MDWPPPRRHRHRYHGVLASNSPLHAAAVVLGRDLSDDPSASAELLRRQIARLLREQRPRVPVDTAYGCFGNRIGRSRTAVDRVSHEDHLQA